VQVPHDRYALDDLLAGESQDQTKYSVRRRMLRS